MCPVYRGVLVSTVYLIQAVMCPDFRYANGVFGTVKCVLFIKVPSFPLYHIQAIVLYTYIAAQGYRDIYRTCIEY